MSRGSPSKSTPPPAAPDPIPGAAPASGLNLARRLWGGYLLRYWPKLAVAGAAMAAYAASAAAIPAGVEWINAALSGAPARGPVAGVIMGPVGVWGPVIILALGVFNAGALYVQARFSASASLCALRDLQMAMFNKLLRIDDAQLRAFGAGQTISRLTNDVAVLRETLTRTLTALRDLLTLLALCAVMIFYDWVLFAVVVGIYAAVGWPVARIGARLRAGSREAQAQSGDIAALAGEAVTGGRMVRVYDLAEPLGAQASAVFDRRLATLQRMARLRAANEPFIFFVGAAALALVIAVVALRIEAGALNVPQFISFIIALLMVSQPARGLSTLNAVTQEGFGAFERMLAVIDAEPTIRDRAGAAALTVRAGAIEFQDVVFAYEGAACAALDGFTLTAPAGRTIALIGESGSGKSTVFNLLSRLYEPQSGRIFIDGQDIAAVSLSSLRAAMAVVSQETILFDDTVAANIGFGRAGASRQEIIAAAQAASADGFIRGLPNGYDTRVGEGGGMLSGGQRQRIAIARAFLKDAPILLLDEATSALDAESEAAIQAALTRLTAGRTTLVIAHRLSTVRTADLIVAMHKGAVVETGAHDEMLARGGYYANAARLQLASA